jgi:peptidoglycan/LPS O-acetylase OafA/YrhL
MEYRKEIDGLRAIAVIPVILFHAGFQRFSGGFVGVDVFFVISGYLITTIILSEKQKGTFSLINFYERRARRILPALFLVMFVSLPFAYFWLVPSDHLSFSQSLVSVASFSSNILFWLESDYFDAAAEMKPLLHTWSLAVEEQYYLLFPLFLMLVWRYRKRWIFATVLILGVVSLSLAQWGALNRPVPTFYLLPTRAWELMIGAIAAFYLLYGKSNNEIVEDNRFVSELLGLLGLALIYISIVFIDKGTPFPSLYALLPTVGVILIILFSSRVTLIGRLLGTRILVGIGLISYSLYLWHQPLFAFARHKNTNEPGQWEYLLLIAMTFLLAYISWRYLERPFRIKSRISRKPVFIFALVGSVFFVAVGFAGHFTNGFENRAFWYSGLLSYEYDNRKLQQQSWDILKDVSNDNKYSVVNNPNDGKLWYELNDNRTRMLLVGNSHSKDLFNILFNSDSAQDEYQLARYGVQIRHLADYSHQFFRSENYTHSDVVVLVSHYMEEDVEAFPLVLERMLEDDKKVFIVKRIFEFEYNPVSFKNLADFELLKQCESSCREGDAGEIALDINKSYYLNYATAKQEKSESARINKEIEKLAAKYEVSVMDRMDYVCDESGGKCFAINERFEKYFYDHAHHTLIGAEFFAELIDSEGIWDDLLFHKKGPGLARR